MYTETNIKYPKQKSKKWIFAGLILAFLIITSALILLLNPFASHEQQPYFSGEAPIIFNGAQVGNALKDKGIFYLPERILQENIDETIQYDEQTHSFIIVQKTKVIQVPLDSKVYYGNGKAKEEKVEVVKVFQNERYINLDFISEMYGLDTSILPETDAIWLRENGEEITKGTVVDKDIDETEARLRTEPSLLSPYTSSISRNEPIYIEDEKDGYYYVRKSSGEAGYMQKPYVLKGQTKVVEIEEKEKEPELPMIDGPIHLTWEAVYSKNPQTKSMPEMPGVNILSPTWFELKDEQGQIKDLGSVEFAEWAKEEGYQLWGLFSNAFDPELTHAAFQSFETRQKIINQLISFSRKYQMEGINIDIENVREEDGPLVTQFVREASAYFHNEGLIVSMDITFISSSGNWSAFYEREQLADIVDYLIVMAYDEHWGSSPVAGSVASLPWVENNLQRLLEVAPNEKLILGVPLYTRIWEETDAGEISSKAVSMSKVKEWIEERELTPKYDASTGQNYAEYYSEDEEKLYKVWLEDEMSLNKRAEMAAEYDLAGVASWSRYFADDTAWTALKLDDDEEGKQ
ncbi:glycosyl hydrolase family 18 protein [Cytobacillus purgationiresistens]|uniref:Spore germination protein YaaH n=1 Tax=Cytobacillus purgationiresistens TaxID=863449 RepID=A0ABU0AC35_9BACI|nr:glycosyl hydrolase family 18 protein [Cytobacillus purgationiresistens]MDQ0268605.1 spore germination protein YaaH [Cytobacillus purgationiresistens]